MRLRPISNNANAIANQKSISPVHQRERENNSGSRNLHYYYVAQILSARSRLFQIQIKLISVSLYSYQKASRHIHIGREHILSAIYTKIGKFHSRDIENETIDLENFSINSTRYGYKYSWNCGEFE